MILVTGASGLLGANFVLHAQKGGTKAVATYHQTPFDIPGVRCVQLDLTDQTTTNDLVKSIRPEWIVHCAALTNVDWCESHLELTYRVNAKASRDLAISARHVGAKLVYISTDAVFDGRSGDYSEEDTPAPVNVYAWSKVKGEELVQAELGSSIIVRTNIYGWNMQSKQSLAEWVLDRVESGQKVPGFHDVVFTPILVNDLSCIILNMIAHDLSGVYHVAGRQACTKYEFALLLTEVFGHTPTAVQPVSIEESSLAAERPRNTSLKTTRVSEVLGQTMPDLRSGLERFRALRESGVVDEMRSYRGG